MSISDLQGVDMNKGYQRMILVTDGTEASDAAEQSALNLAKRHAATVVVVNTVQRRSSVARWLTSKYDDHFEELVTEKQERLEKIAARFTKAGMAVEAEVLIGKSSEAIVRKVLIENADLVVRYRKGPASRQFHSRFGATAINLMRVCPCPLLLVGEKPVADPKILACVDAKHPADENQVILQAASTIASENQNLYAVYCWVYSYYAHLGEQYADKLHPDLPEGQTELKLFLEEEAKYYREIYDRFVEQHDLSEFPGGLHLENGEPAKVIPEMCRQRDVDVVVMSSATLNHPLRRLLGSTVESVIEQLPCALLVVKPTGFKTPVKAVPAGIQRGLTGDAARIRQKVTSPKAYVTVFDDLSTAKRAVETLHAAGFSLDKIELITRNVHGQAPDIETPQDHETTGSSMFENATKWGSVGTAAGALSIVFVPFPGLVLGMMAVGGLTGAIMGAVIGVEHAVEDDSVDLPTLAEYEELVRHGKCLVVVRGTHNEVSEVKSIINEMHATRSHLLTLHGHESHEHPIRK
jgi:nucleotide-binding universal stress UspA family protein